MTLNPVIGFIEFTGSRHNNVSVCCNLQNYLPRSTRRLARPPCFQYRAETRLDGDRTAIEEFYHRHWEGHVVEEIVRLWG